MRIGNASIPLTRSLALWTLLGLSLSTAWSAEVMIVATGGVDFNSIKAEPLGNANANDPVTLTGIVDSRYFTNSASFPTRGYHIFHGSFALSLGAVTIGLQDPFPAATVPYFVIRDNDPAVDGFFISTNIIFYPILIN